jgi:hypothetical protein
MYDFASPYAVADPNAGPDVFAQGTGELTASYAGSDRALFMIGVGALAVLWIAGGTAFKDIRI